MYTISYKGIEVICSTPAELDAVIDGLTGPFCCRCKRRKTERMGQRWMSSCRHCLDVITKRRGAKQELPPKFRDRHANHNPEPEYEPNPAPDGGRK